MAANDNEKSSLEELLAQYIDRLNDGERIGSEEILAENPVLGPEIVEHLEGFIEWTVDKDPETPLGTLGDYTLRRQIGRGGMGVVYEAWENSMDRRVALKVLPAGVAADEKAVVRFTREARLAGKLEHQNIVRVYSTGVREGTPWYSMEFVEGETLAQVLARFKEVKPEAETPFGPKDQVDYFAKLARCFADVADGLQHAHSKGIIHRDIKPSNLILDCEGGLRILDFGLARLEGQESLTISGDVVGTPLYMSPEQAKRKKIPVDHRTDVYSLGATLYEMLTLQPPFKGKDHQDTLSQIIERDAVEPRKVNPRVPKDLETIVLKCLRKDAADRYGTAEAMGQDLRRFTRGDAIEARPQTGWERAWRRGWRVRFRIATGLLLAAALAGAGWQGLQLRREAVQRRTREYEEKVLSAAIHLELASLTKKAEGGEESFFGSMPGERLKLPLDFDPVDLALKEVDEAVRLIPGRPDASYHRARGLLMQERTAEARETLEPLVARRPPFVPALTLLAGLHERRGGEEPLKQDLDDAERAPNAKWEKAWIRVWRGWKERKHQEIAAAYTEILGECEATGEPFIGCALRTRLARGVASLHAKDYVAAMRDFTAARLVVPRAVPPALLEGEVWYRLGRKDDAERIFEETLSRSTPADEVALAVHLIYAGLGDEAKAEAWNDKISRTSVREQARCQRLFNLGRMEAAVAAGRKAFAADPKDAGACDRLYFVLQQSGRLAEAREVLEEGLKRSPDSYQLNWNRGYLAWRYGAYRDAISFYECAISSRRANLTGEHYYLAGVYLQAGEREKAMATITRARELYPEDAEGENMFGLAHFAWGEIDEAITAYDRGIASEPGFSYCHANKGNALHALGRENEALVCWRNGQKLYPLSITCFVHPALVLEGHGELYAAISELLKACERVPEEAGIHFDLAGLLRSARGRLEAPEVESLVTALEHVLERSRTSRWCKNSLAEALLLRVPAERCDLERAASLLLGALDEDRIPFREQTVIAWSLTEASSELATQRFSDMRQVDWIQVPPAYAATDAIVAGAGGAMFDAQEVELLSYSARDPKARNRLRYLESRLAKKAGDLSSAARGLAEVVSADPENVEPRLQLSEVLQASGNAAEALSTLRAGLAATADRRLWDKWLQVSFADPVRTPAELLHDLPDGMPGDLLWLLAAITEGGAVRINCGAEDDYRDRAGRLWSKDRFSLGGWALWPVSLDVVNTEDDPLYQTERRFETFQTLADYIVPMPPGRYRVRLHFAEVFLKNPGLRRFDVLLQGERVLESFDIVREAGFAHAIVKEFEAAVTGGSLEIRFDRPPGRSAWLPKISAIEIERDE